MIIPSRRTAVTALAVVSAMWGAGAAWHYHALGLTLSHYDARGHLVVARRIFDSVTPGWQQIGAVWLPLPHLLNALPVQVDVFYRTGASGVAISIASFVLTVVSIAWIVEMLTDSRLAAVASAAVFAANPSVLYLQATPMTEPLLLGLTTWAVALLIHDTRMAGLKSRSADEGLTRRADSGIFATGVAFALACLTRYEAWPVTGAALTLAVWARWRAGERLEHALAHLSRIAAYPATVVLAFAIFSRIVVGEWLVSSGFFIPENAAIGHPFDALKQIVWGTRALSGTGLVAAAIAGLLFIVLTGALNRRRGDLLIASSFLATAVVPWFAFFKGHPYRIRYMVPLMAAEALAAGIAAGSVRRLRPLALLALATIAIAEIRPFDMSAPMIVEAQWDRPNLAGRLPVSDYLHGHYDGTTVMASMGSLGHYMQELSHEGFALKDFLHEGNGDIWLSALDAPRPYAGWILIEEKAEGGDMLAVESREHSAFLAGYSRVAEGAGLALYRRIGEPDAAAVQNLRLNVSR